MPKHAPRALALAITALTVAVAPAVAGCQHDDTSSPSATSAATSAAGPTGGPATTAAGTESATATTTTTATGASTAAGSATVLPFAGLDHPLGVAVGSGVIVVDSANNRVVKLAEQSPTQTLLSFTGLNAPQSVSNDNGNLFVSDGGGTRVLWSSDRSSAPTPPWTASGSSREWSGPFTGLQNPHGVYAGGGAYYVVDTGQQPGAAVGRPAGIRRRRCRSPD
ncbi:NHL repeat-containing protein [Mycolicibacterium insubricum]|uniref:hypothetical protein n=1 Tax=Mycolicibacterium insubricum TaxID=444597 RepID=UPI0021F2BF14|nr:hypothetical protein [Mycolicibacterium insubricum]